VSKAPEFDGKSIGPRWNRHICDDTSGHLNVNRRNSNNINLCVRRQSRAIKADCFDQKNISSGLENKKQYKISLHKWKSKLQHKELKKLIWITK